MRVLVAAFGVAFLTATVACVREGAPPLAPVDVAVADLGDAGAAQLPITSAPAAGRERCTARLKPGAIKTGAGCTLDERISKNDGLLLYPCSGNGSAEAVFGEHRFEGSMSDGAVSLDLTTEIDWEDGCHWETKQVIHGELREGKSAKLAWSYTEGPVSGTSCYGSCEARAGIDVQR
ncbi:MAG TPA: hypothetical protein VLT33_07110 [Labilithrix sp.]|nr:hypothetical protein [Labilithrix sp.]